MNPSVIIWGNKNTIQGCSAEKIAERCSISPRSYIVYILDTIFPVLIYLLFLLLYSLCMKMKIPKFCLDVYTIFLFVLPTHLFFVITQFKKPHLSRSRYPLRLLLLLQPLLLVRPSSHFWESKSMKPSSYYNGEFQTHIQQHKKQTKKWEMQWYMVLAQD